VQQLKEIGKAMGLKGSELASFIKEQQTLEREEREKLRQEKDKEDERLVKLREFELQKADQEAKERDKDRQLEIDRIKEKEKDRQFELEKAKIALSQKEREAQIAAEHEQEKYKYEMERMEKQQILQESRVKSESDKTDDGVQMVTNKGLAKVQRMPYFDEERDFIDSYLGRFECFAESQKWNKSHWAMYLSALLKGQALDVFSMMPAEQANDHDKLKDALLKRYLLPADGFKRRFRSAKPETGETLSQFLTRLDNYLEHWIELAKVTKSYEGLKTLFVRKKYLSTCPKDMAIHLKEGKPETISQLAEIAENYIEAHASDIVFGIDPKLRRIRSLQTGPPKCSKCGKVGHTISQCC